MKKFLTTITTVLVAVLLVSSHIGISFAESNFAGMPDSLKNLVKDNYWAKNRQIKFIPIWTTRTQWRWYNYVDSKL